MTAALAPAHLRVGGSEGDLVQYVLPGFPCALPPNQNATANPVPFCLNQTRWAAINAFAAQANVTLAFGLNAMQGRRSASAPMDTANLAAFLRATAAAGIGAHNTLPFLEFGNELEFKCSPSAYAADAVRVAGLIADAWPQPAQRPRLVANDENPDPSYWSTMLPLLPAGTLAAASWHEYVGYGLDPDLPTKCLDASFLDGVKSTAARQVAAAAQAKFAGALWVGETALAWHSGRNGTTNAFASSFWYLVQLGALAATHAVQCRQTLVGGYYELIDKTTRSPNPDFYTALFCGRRPWARACSQPASPPPPRRSCACLRTAPRAGRPAAASRSPLPTSTRPPRTSSTSAARAAPAWPRRATSTTSRPSAATSLRRPPPSTASRWRTPGPARSTRSRPSPSPTPPRRSFSSRARSDSSSPGGGECVLRGWR